MKFKLNSFVCLCLRTAFLLLVVLFQLTSNLEAAPAGNDSQAMVSVNFLKTYCHTFIIVISYISFAGNLFTKLKYLFFFSTNK